MIFFCFWPKSHQIFCSRVVMTWYMSKMGFILWYSYEIRNNWYIHKIGTLETCHKGDFETFLFLFVWQTNKKLYARPCVLGQNLGAQKASFFYNKKLTYPPLEVGKQRILRCRRRRCLDVWHFFSSFISNPKVFEWQN